MTHSNNRVRVIAAIALSIALVTGIGGSVNSAFANPGSGTIFVAVPFNQELYTVSNAGVFTLVGTPTDAAGNVIRINTLAIDPSSQIMYGGEGQGSGDLYIVNQATAEVTLVGPNGVGAYDALDFGLGGVLYGTLLNGDLVTVDETTGGIITNLGNTGLDIGGISFDVGGILWANDKVTTDIYTINPATAQAALVALGDGFIDPAGLQLLCDGTAYAGDLTGGPFGTVDLLTGVFTQLSNAPETPGGMTVTDICAVGGEFLPIDSTALLIAGAGANAIWILPVLAGLAGAGIYLTRSKLNWI